MKARILFRFKLLHIQQVTKHTAWLIAPFKFQNKSHWKNDIEPLFTESSFDEKRKKIPETYFEGTKIVRFS